MKNTASSLLICITFSLIFLYTPLISSAQLGWFTEVIDPDLTDADDYDAAATTITPGYLGIPWMSYVDGPYDGERFHVKVSWLSDADEWIISTVDTNTWGHASLVVESDWTPHLCYRQGHMYGQGILRHAYRDNLYNWVVETVDPEMGLQDPAIAINGEDNPVIVYGCGQYPNQNLKIAEWNGVNWEIEIIDSTGKCEEISFVFDSGGNPHISYVLSSGGCFLKYVHWNGEHWEDEVLEQITSGYSTSLALDSGDNPHLVYHYGAEGIWYTYNTSGEWETEQVDGDYCWYARLALSLTDEPYIAYYHADNGALMFAIKTVGQWIIQTVDDDPSPMIRIGRFPAIMANYWGDVCISYYYHEAGQPCELKYAAGYLQHTWINLIPYNPPIIIPASGGSFEFNLEVNNPTLLADTIDIWTNAVLQPGWDFGPFFLMRDFIVPPNWSGSVDRIQEVPGRASPGQYYYRAFIGDYDSTIVNMSSFQFEKLAAGDGTLVDGWNNTGEPFDLWLAETEPEAPSEFVFLGAYPNPFNPATTLRFSLPVADLVELSVYDVSGRLVMELVDGWRDAGVHEVTFNGSGLASGVYIYRMETGEYTAAGKMVLMK